MAISALSRAKIFVNASSGWDAKEGASDLLRRTFEAAGIHADIEYVEAGVNLAQKSREAVTSGADIVVAGGGDGTISAAAAGVAQTSAKLGILPVGTLNHFARDLNLPLNLDEAAQVITDGVATEVDVAQVNGKIYINNSILGLYPIYRFLKARHEQRVGSKRLALFMAAASVFRRYPLLRVRFRTDDLHIERKTPYVLIANNRHAMVGYHLGARESMAEGKLWVYIMRDRGRWGLFRLLLKLVAGRFDAADDFDIFPAEEVWVETHRRTRIGVALDGEIAVMDTPLHYRILPRALKVVTSKAP
jgi:diacylglycerol kinase family enzyme